jgi:hypothetical protein
MTAAPASLLADFQRDGFVAFDRPMFDTADLRIVATLLDGLLARASTLPRRVVNDLAFGGAEGGHILEVEEALHFEPRLRDTAVFEGCCALAEELFGCRMGTHFDHVIRKGPRNLASTAWHQDVAYSRPDDALPVSGSFWLSMQDTTEAHGCMEFIPGSHHKLYPHRRRGGVTSPVLEVRDVDTSQVVRCPLPYGGLTVHHPRTLHHTGPNTTDEPRLAWIIQFRELESIRPSSLLDRGRYHVRKWVRQPRGKRPGQPR